MRRGLLFAFVALSLGGGIACLATIDESRLQTEPDDDAKTRDAKAPPPKKDGAADVFVPDPDASLDPTKTPDGGLSCPEPSTLCGDRCFDLMSSNANCKTCGTPCETGTTCTAGTCRAPSCKAVLGANPAATTGPTPISFQGAEVSVFCDQGTRGGGWTMVHRLSAGPGLTGDPLTFYTTIPLNDTSPTEVTPKKTTTHYTSRILGAWNAAFPVNEVMIRVYDEAGNAKKEAVFKGTGTTFLSFMQPANLTASSWTDLNGAGVFSDFGVDGTAGLQRRFLLHKKYSVCPEDTGWLIVHGTPADVPCKAEYEAPFDRIRVVYAAGNNAQLWTDGVAEAASFAVFVR